MPGLKFPLSLLWQIARLLLGVALLASCHANYPKPPAATPAITRQSVTPSPTASAPTGARSTQAPSPTSEATATSSTITAPTGTPALEPDATGRVMAPILLYHHVSDMGSGRYYVPVNTFREQMQYLHDQGYHSLSITQLASAIRGNVALPEKPVVITFDDGYLDIYANALPVMKEYGFTGVAYVITSTLDPGKAYGYMQKAELKALLAAGWEIGSHSVTHSDLTKSKLGIGNEMKQSKAALEKLLDTPILSFAYPYGVANPWIEDRAAEFGYTSAAGINILDFHSPKQLYFLSRREVYRTLSGAGFRDLLTPSALELANNPGAATPEDK